MWQNIIQRTAIRLAIRLNWQTLSKSYSHPPLFSS